MSSRPPDSSVTPDETEQKPAGPTADFQPSPPGTPPADSEASPIATSDYAPPAAPVLEPEGTPPTSEYSPRPARAAPPEPPKIGTRTDKKSAAGPISDDAGAFYGPTGRYVLKHFHAKGGMGEIWQAEDRTIGRVVALKRMRRPDKPTHREQFVLEAQITGQLEHPGIVPVYELGWGEADQAFYAMKFVQGSTLEKEIAAYHGSRRKTGQADEVKWRQLLQAFVSLCQTVAFAHSRGVLHRDIKPENVMLGPYGETMVLDWGLAKVVDQPEQSLLSSASIVLPGTGSKHTVAGSVKGTPAYMPPEMASGRAAEADERSDVYLLGATLYQLLTGRSPRQGRSFLEIVELARKEKPPAPRSYDKSIPRALEAICLKAMAWEAADRYAGALALAEDMQRYLAGEPVTAYREPWYERLGRWARRHRRTLVQSAAAAVVLTAAAVGWVKLKEAEQSREAARQQAALLLHQDEARRDVQQFRSLADEAHYYFANTNPAGERAPYYDPARGEAKARDALAVVEKWGPTLDALPVAEQQPPLKQEVYDLLLLVAASRARQANGSGPEVLALLDHAAALGEPTRGYYRLRAEGCQQSGRPDEAAAEQRRADDPLTPTTALDHFLQGEQLRLAAARKGENVADRHVTEPDRDLMTRALDEYRQALRLDPTHFWSHYQLGRCYLSLRKAEAAEAFSACVALRPDSPWGYSARAHALMQLDRLAEAERDFDKALSLNLDLRPARLSKGVLLYAQGKHNAALREFDAALQPPEEKRLAEGLYYRGQVLANRGEYRKALADFDGVITERPAYRPPYEFRALVHFALEENDKGLADLNGYLAGQRGFDLQGREAFAQRGRLMRRFVYELPQQVRRGFLALALAQLKKAEELGSRSPAFFADLGSVQELLGKLDDAIASYTTGLKDSPQDARLLVKRGWAYAQRKRYELAAADFGAVVAKQSDHAEAHSGLGYVKACRKSAPEARHQANLALLHGAGDYLILHNVACIYAALSEADPRQAKEHQDLALAFLQRAVELWRRGGAGPNEVNLIENEQAFPPALRDRPEFQKLLEKG